MQERAPSSIIIVIIGKKLPFFFCQCKLEHEGWADKSFVRVFNTQKSLHQCRKVAPSYLFMTVAWAYSTPQRWSIFRAMRYRFFLERLNIVIGAIIFLDHRDRLFFDYLLILRTDYFAIIHDLPPHFNNSYSC